MNVRLKELFSNTILFTISNLGSKILVFFMVPFYTYVLTPYQFGIAGIIQTTATLLVPILTMQICDAVLKYSFEKNSNKNVIFTSGLYVCLLGFLASALIIPIFLVIPLFDDVKDYLFLIPLLVGSTAFYGLFSYFARSIDHVRASAIGGMLDTFANIVFNLLFLLYFRFGVIGFIISCVIADSIAAIYIFLTCSLHRYFSKDCEISVLYKMLSFSIPLIPAVLSWWLLNGFNNYYIMSVIGAVAVGIYSAALRVPSVLVVMSNIFSQAWLLSALQNYGTPEGFSFIRTMHRHFFSLLLLLTGSVVLFSYPIATLMLSGEFSEYWNLTPFLFVSVFYSTLVGFYGSLFSAGEKTMIQFISSLIGTLVSIALIVFFLSDYGLIIVSLATMIGNCVIWIIRKIALNRIINLDYPTFQAVLLSLLLVIIAYEVMTGNYLVSLLVYGLLVVLNRKSIIKLSFMLKGSALPYMKKQANRMKL